MTTSQGAWYRVRTGRRAAVRLGVVVCATLVAAGCAPRLLSLPTDPGNPLPDFIQVHREVTRACAGVRTLTAELSLAGRAGAQRVRGRAIVGFERPDAMRLEGVAPFGPPAFILAARAAEATLLLPRDNRVLRGARADDILRAITGVGLAPADLQAVLTGCVSATPGATGGRVHENGWASVDLVEGGVLYLRRTADAWQVRAARRAGWQVEYPAWQGPFPSVVRLRSTEAGLEVDVTATVSQIEANLPVNPAAFTVDAPADARELTLAELQNAGPLRGDR